MILYLLYKRYSYILLPNETLTPSVLMGRLSLFPYECQNTCSSITIFMIWYTSSASKFILIPSEASSFEGSFDIILY